MNTKTKIFFIQVVSMLLMFMFSYTAINKLLNRQSFRITMSVSPLISNFATLLSWLIPLIEITIVALLFFKKSRTAGLLASAGLMVSFTIYIGYMFLFVPERPCSCGGILSAMSWSQHFVFNIFFSALAFTAYYLLSHKRFIAINRTSRTPV